MKSSRLTTSSTIRPASRARATATTYSTMLSADHFTSPGFSTATARTYSFSSRRNMRNNFSITDRRRCAFLPNVSVPGDFSQTFDVNRNLIAVHDPMNGGHTFPGNLIPASRFSTIGQNILKLLPLPNYTDPNPLNLYQWNYFVDASAS